MFEMLNRAKLLKDTQFILCVLLEKKSDIYGPWKKKCLSDFGIVTQCIYPSTINDQYLTNVVGSLCWPHISRYRASVRAQSPKEEMIDALYNPLANGKDDGMMRKLLENFCHTSNGNKPKHIIVFKNGVAESQFSKVLNVAVEQILKAYQDLFKSEVDVPKFTVIVAQKDHHTKLFQDISPENVPSGTKGGPVPELPGLHKMLLVRCSSADVLLNVLRNIVVLHLLAIAASVLRLTTTVSCGA
ncbi:hypothetical protein GH714_019160 [Hevea brasiliensis]|uniref:Piwi domain-containing protein n=1 Tax=Hevea brasiliensis TaxID=3981 RepID=A0A6A6KVX1_HEVBR|nr:hypothetical protein GH714_019160 [Hevea brasiliensis]